MKPVQYHRISDIFSILLHTVGMKHELKIIFVFHEKLYDLNLFLQKYNLAQNIEYISDSNFKLFEQFNIPIQYSTISQTYLTKKTTLFLCKGKKIINSLKYSKKIPLDFLILT
jgi:peroxiredoxin